MFLACLAGAPVVIGIVWLVCLAGDGTQEKVRRDTCAGALAVSVLFIVGAIIIWFLPVDISNDAQGSFGAPVFYIAGLLASGIIGLALTLVLWLVLPGKETIVSSR